MVRGGERASLHSAAASFGYTFCIIWYNLAETREIRQAGLCEGRTRVYRVRGASPATQDVAAGERSRLRARWLPALAQAAANSRSGKFQNILGLAYNHARGATLGLGGELAKIPESGTSLIKSLLLVARFRPAAMAQSHRSLPFYSHALLDHTMGL
jgi:hypothetical protein